MKKIFFILVTLLTTPLSVGAAVTLPNPLGNSVDTVPELINKIIIAILGIIGALALLMFVWGGLLWMTSGGNSDRIKKGKETLVWASLGLLIIFASYSLVTTIFRALANNS